jgi:UDP-glucose-4-epimerase GalE
MVPAADPYITGSAVADLNKFFWRQDMHSVLVTGGAGYIGSHTVKLLHQRGYQPVIYDQVISEHHRTVLRGECVQGNLHDTACLVDTLRQYQIMAVIHFAAFAYVGESVRDPLKYYYNNVAGTLSLLQAMHAAGVHRFLFSSTCATYGTPQQPFLTEDHPQHPINPYGESKLFVERILQACTPAYGLRWISLRYFNAAGADPDATLGEEHDPETHLIPLILAVASGRLPEIAVFGTDYDTPDGTCIRDYIHVLDLADAHLLALQALDSDKANAAYNLGTGSGYSVRQVIDTAARITGRPIASVVAPRRPGDPPRLVAAADKAHHLLGWTPRYSDLETIIATAWRWECQRYATAPRHTAQR